MRRNFGLEHKFGSHMTKLGNVPSPNSDDCPFSTGIIHDRLRPSANRNFGDRRRDDPSTLIHPRFRRWEERQALLHLHSPRFRQQEEGRSLLNRRSPRFRRQEEGQPLLHPRSPRIRHEEGGTSFGARRRDDGQPPSTLTHLNFGTRRNVLYLLY